MFEGLKELSNHSVDVVLSDLPYGTTQCSWDTPIDLNMMWLELCRVTKPEAAILMHSAQPFTTQLIQSNFKNFKYCWYWNKCFAGNFVQAKRMPLRTIEELCVFSFGSKLPTYYPQMVERDTPIRKGGNKQSEAIPIAQSNTAKKFEKTTKIYTHKHPTNLVTFNVRVDRGHHPTQKPVALYKYLLNTYSKEGAVVLDICFGAGASAIAARDLNRNYIGFEKEQKYVRIAKSRLYPQDDIWDQLIVNV